MIREIEYGRFALLFALTVANILIWSGAGHTKAPDQIKHLECTDVSNWKQECYWRPRIQKEPEKYWSPRYEWTSHYDLTPEEVRYLRYRCLKGYKYDFKLNKCRKKKFLGIL